MPNDRLVTIARHDTTGDAHLAKAQLEDAGIPSVLANEEQSGLATMFDATRNGVEVKVPQDQAHNARTVLGLAQGETDE